MDAIQPSPLPISRVATWTQALGTGPIQWQGFDRLMGTPPGTEPRDLAAYAAYIHPEDRERWRALSLPRLEAGGQVPFSVTHRMLRPDGSVIWVQSMGCLERSGPDDAGRVWGTLLDITDARHAVLTERAALGADGSAWWTWRPDTGAIEWSRRLGPLFGREPGYTPTTSEEFFDLLHPDDAARVRSLVAPAAEQMTSVEVDYRVLVGGEVRWLHSSVIIERDVEGTARYLGLTRDVTHTKASSAELAASAERFRLLAEHGTDAIAIIARDSTYEYVSPKAAAMLGWDMAALVGANPYDHVHPDDFARVHREITEPRLRGERELPMVEMRYRGQDGSYRLIEVGFSPLFNADGSNRGAIAMARDISQRVEREAQARLQEKARAVATLVGGIAHNFNNHLAAIRIHADLLALAHEPGTAEHGWLDQIVAATDRAGLLSRQLLTFTRQDLQAPVTRELDALLAELVPALAVRAATARHEVRLRAGAPGLHVRVDERELGIVLHELVANACDAMQRDGVVEVVTCGEGGSVRLEVRDHGPGLSEVARQRLFEPFFSTREFGRGLGLSVARAIVESAQGSLRVESEAGQGVTCIVLLPLAAAVSPAPTPRRTLLVVDDDAPVLQAMAHGLRNAGYDVLTATSPEEALAELMSRDGNVDVLLADFIMPGMRGDELLRVVTSRWPAIRTVIVSGFIDDDRVREVLLERGTAFIQKPISLRALVAAVEQQLSR